MSSLVLDGAAVVVTGGGGHLGRGIALAAAAAGATVFICGRSLDTLEDVVAAHRVSGAGRMVAVAADVADDESIQMVLDRVESEVGSVHGWVNNAYAGLGGLLGELTRERVEHDLLRGLADVILATDAVAKRMAPGGAIVNVASMYGMVSPQPPAYVTAPQMHNPPVYGAAKAGVIQFTRYAACHFAGRGLRVNCVSPGPFPPATVETQAPDFIAALSQRTALGRIGHPREVGDAVVFLLSSGSSYVTGHNLVVDGGWTAW